MTTLLGNVSWVVECLKPTLDMVLSLLITSFVVLFFVFFNSINQPLYSRPFYRILCDEDDEQRAFGSHRTVGVRYVAEANLKPAVQSAVENDASCTRSGLRVESAVRASSSSSSSWVSPVRSSHRSSYFTGFDPQHGACLPSAALRFSYPNDYASLAPGPASKLVALSSKSAAAAGLSGAGGSAVEPTSPPIRAGLHSATINDNSSSARSSARTTTTTSVGNAFAAESSAIQRMITELEAFDAMLQEKLATLGTSNKHNNTTNNSIDGSSIGMNGSNKSSFKDDCSALLRTAPGERSARYAEDVLRLTSRAHGNEAVKDQMSLTSSCHVLLLFRTFFVAQLNLDKYSEKADQRCSSLYNLFFVCNLRN